MQVSTKEYTLESTWNKSKERVRAGAEGANFINPVLNQIENELNTYFMEMSVSRSYPEERRIKEIIERTSSISGLLSEYTDKFIKDTLAGKRKTSAGKEIKAGTIKNYKAAFKCLHKFIKEERLKDSLLTLTGDFSERWQFWQWHKENYFDNYVGRNAKIMNAFTAWLKEQGIDIKQKFKVWKEEIGIVVLYPDELKELYLWNPENEIIELTRDMFLLGCMTGLRISNLINLDNTNVNTVGANVSIDVIAVKTEKPISVRLGRAGADIVSKYLAIGKLFKDVSDQEFNRRLKEMAVAFRAHMVKQQITPKGNSWHKNFTRVRYKQGRPFYESVPFNQMITSHTMRRTCITVLLMTGMSETEVKLISGHSMNSKEFARYVKIAQFYLHNKTQSSWNSILD